MPLDFRTQDEFVRAEIAAIQSQLPNTFNFQLGSVVLALTEAHGRTAIWEESLIAFVLARTRLATSTATDVDSWLADFNLERPPGNPASGLATFSSVTPTQPRIILVGQTVSTSIGNIQFTVQPDTSNSYFNPDTNQYTIPANVPSDAILVQAVISGTIGNVAMGQIDTITSPIPGIDNVTNASAFDNGQDPATDIQSRNFFVSYINSLSRATQGAIQFAIQSIPQVVEYSIVENMNYNTNATQLGYFYVVIDDGTGSPSMNLINQVYAAVNAYRGLTIQFGVFAPVIVDATVTATVTLPIGYTNSTLAATIEAAINLYISMIPFGQTLFYSRISQIIYNTIMQVAPSFISQINVSAILLNGGTADLTSTPQQAIKPLNTLITVV